MDPAGHRTLCPRPYKVGRGTYTHPQRGKDEEGPNHGGRRAGGCPASRSRGLGHRQGEHPRTAPRRDARRHSRARAGVPETSQSQTTATAQPRSPATTRRSSTSTNRLRRAGYNVNLDAFDFASGRRTVRRRSTESPSPHTWVEDTDYIVAQFSGGGDVTAPVFVAGNTSCPRRRRGHVDQRLRPADFRRHPLEHRADAAGYLPVRSEVPERAWTRALAPR